MDHNLDTLNLDSAMGVDFETADHVEVSQADLALSSSGQGMVMEFEEEQPMLMETGSEEIIDFMGDGCGEFTLQEYSVQDNQTTGLTTIAESNQNVLTSQTETMLDLQLQPQTRVTPDARKIISVKAAIPSRASSTPKIATAAPPRQVAIAPKPPRLAIKSFGTQFGGKQFAIAPKPVALVKKVSVGNVVQGNAKGNTVLAQIGKQLVVMPAGTQKLKLVNPSSSSVQYLRTNSDQASLIQTKEQQPRPVMMTKVIVQGQQNVDLNQPAVITKILPTSTAPTSQARFVALPQKAVPIAIGNKVVMASPTKQGVKLGKKQQIIAIQSPSAKLLPAPAPGGTTKKVVISANPSQNVILKTTAPPKVSQIGKDNVLIDGQHTQLHQINVPGKGIQYIRLVTQNAAQSNKAQTQGSLLPSKFVLTDNKAGGKKLVRIAPVPKTSLTQPTRSSQSLLAPLSPAIEQPTVDINDILAVKQELVEQGEAQGQLESEHVDSKAALHSLIENTIADDTHDMQLSMTEVEIDYKRPLPAYTRKRIMEEKRKSPIVSDRRSVEQTQEPRPEEPQHPLIVIQSGYDMPSDVIVPDDPAAIRMDDDDDDSQRSMLNMEADMMNSNDSPTTPQASESEMVATEFGMRPRKACNCTKSQCLKLYCDCFANGEFCNRCNCTNCHNNLENEELRQKAIRGCLDRNPNAFRPKIGKAKSGGPEIVRRHNKGCNCKRSGCLKNYCECYEAKIACTAICKCVGCRNVEDSLERFRRQEPARPPHPHLPHLPHLPPAPHHYRAAAPAVTKQPCSFMTSEVIEAVCQCLVAAAGEPERGAERVAERGGEHGGERDPLRDVIEEFARCLQDIIGAAHHATPPTLLDQGTA